MTKTIQTILLFSLVLCGLQGSTPLQVGSFTVRPIIEESDRRIWRRWMEEPGMPKVKALYAGVQSEIFRAFPPGCWPKTDEADRLSGDQEFNALALAMAGTGFHNSPLGYVLLDLFNGALEEVRSGAWAVEVVEGHYVIIDGREYCVFRAKILQRAADGGCVRWTYTHTEIDSQGHRETVRAVLDLELIVAER